MLVGNTKFHAIRFISIPIATDNAASTGIAIYVVCNHIKGIFNILNALHMKTSPELVLSLVRISQKLSKVFENWAGNYLGI